MYVYCTRKRADDAFRCMRETRFSFVFVPFHAWMACEPTHVVRIYTFMSAFADLGSTTQTPSASPSGVMGEASVVYVCGCGCVGVGVTHIFSDAAVILHIERKIQ